VLEEGLGWVGREAQQTRKGLQVGGKTMAQAEPLPLEEGAGVCMDPACSRMRLPGTSFCKEHQQAHETEVAAETGMQTPQKQEERHLAPSTLTKRCKSPGCPKSAQRGGKCIAHGGGKKCKVEGCTTSARAKFDVCVRHGAKERRCAEEGCENRALKGKKCKAHGGGHRCQHPGCDKSAESRSDFCISHGAKGRRCSHANCNKHAMKGGKCIAHGGGRRCTKLGCEKSAVGGSGLCVAHGAPKSKCRHEGCDNNNAGGGYCKQHGGGRCRQDGCWKVRTKFSKFCKTHAGANLEEELNINQEGASPTHREPASSKNVDSSVPLSSEPTASSITSTSLSSSSSSVLGAATLSAHKRKRKRTNSNDQEEAHVSQKKLTKMEKNGK